MPISASTNTLFNDGALKYGGKLETLNRPATPITPGSQISGATNLGVYLFEQITITRPVKKIRRPDEIGGPNGTVYIADFGSGSATIQFGGGSAGNVWPRNGDFFTDTFDAGIGAEYYLLLDVSQPFEMNGYFKVTCSLDKLYFAATD